MDKTAIKNFAVWAREKLIDDIKTKAAMLGITDKNIVEKLPQSTNDLHFFDVGTKDYFSISGKEISQRDDLVRKIKDKEKETNNYKEAFNQVVEEVAYTWFNRLIAIRFMEVNEYLPSSVRVLSSKTKGKNEPDIVTSPFDTDLEFSAEEKDNIIKLKLDNKLDELFRLLFIKKCNHLHDILPELFEKTDDYTELLLTISFTDKDGIVYRLVNDIDEDNFNVEKEGQIEIIGWLYQYYISKRKDEVINIFKGTIKKADIPAATQIFTTDWVVKYMVDNSLGRYWIERNPDSNLADKLEFFVTPKSNKINYIDENINPTDLTFFDPCMGSGHILVYAFDVLMEIYRECGYTDIDASISIIENNLYGLDIDKRAYQLAYFAVMMKARSYNRFIFRRKISNNITFIEESNLIDKFKYEGLTDNEEQNSIGEYLIEAFKDAKEIGSLLTIEEQDYYKFVEYLNNIKCKYGTLDFFAREWVDYVLPKMEQFAKQANIMKKKYSVVCTNPPYMNKIEGKLKEFVLSKYKDYSGDLFSVFMYRNFGYCKKNGYSAFMAPFVWMFIKTYEKLREYIVNNKSIVSLIQMEYSAFEEATVPVCTFVLKNGKETGKGLYIRLSDFKGGMDIQKEKVLKAIEDKDCGYFYEAEENNFNKIPGKPIAYWASENIIKAFKNGEMMENLLDVKQGLATADNNRFLRYWFEVNINKCKFDSVDAKDLIESGKKWIPYNKGGQRRQWYGNYDYLVNWENDGYEIKNFFDNSGKLRSRPQNTDSYFKAAITWGLITSGGFSIRYRTFGGIHDVAGMSAFYNGRLSLKYILGLMSTPIADKIFKMLNPTINLQVGDFKNFPVLINDKRKDLIIKISEKCIYKSKQDWDSFETSWDFTCHPLINGETTVKKSFEKWKIECNDRFNSLKENEEELNRIFINIYGLEEELTPEVSDKDITVTKVFNTKEDIYDDIKGNAYIQTKEDVIKSLISYAVGCMFGRYSLDVEGLAYAGGNWDESKYRTFIPDSDNCIPVTDKGYLKEDIVGLFCAWLKKVYRIETFEENLNFIADALGTNGNTSREKIRNYFLKGFIEDHNKIYKKRPIYWMFDSGNNNGFKALCYMHRWNKDTIGRVRVDYLHKVQKIYENEINHMDIIVENTKDNR